MQKRRWFILVGMVVAVLSLAVLAAACGDDDGGDGNGAPTETAEPADGDATQPADGETTIDAELTEFVVDLSTDTATAGTVTFSVTNNGTIPHDFRVIKTDLDVADLPYDDTTFTVDESELDVVAASEILDVGVAEDVTADLEAGSYVIICNVPTHYEAGTRVAFTVE